MPTSDGRPIIAVDFDGTLSTTEGVQYPGCGEPNIKLIEKLKALKQTKSAVIIIWTCRVGNDLTLVKEFLQKYSVPYDKINQNYEELLEFGYPKIVADVYVDDRARTPEQFIQTGIDDINFHDCNGQKIDLHYQAPETHLVEIANIPSDVAKEVIKQFFFRPNVPMEIKNNSTGVKLMAKVPKTKNASVGFCIAKIDPFLEEDFRSILHKPERFSFINDNKGTTKVYLKDY